MLFRRLGRKTRSDVNVKEEEGGSDGSAAVRPTKNLSEPDRERLLKEYFHNAIEDSVLIQRDVLVDMYRGFEKVLKFVGGLLYASAKDAGRTMSKRLIDQGLIDDSNVADIMFRSFVIAGYAEEMTIKSIEVKGDRTIIEVEGKNMLLGSRLKGKHHVDQPLAGYMAGWLEAFYHKRVDAKEVECEARGSPACRFRIEIRERRPELKMLEGARYVRSELLRTDRCT